MAQDQLAGKQVACPSCQQPLLIQPPPQATPAGQSVVPQQPTPVQPQMPRAAVPLPPAPVNPAPVAPVQQPDPLLGNPLGAGVSDPLAGAADPLLGVADPLQSGVPQAYAPTRYEKSRGKKTKGNHRTLVIVGAAATGVVALGAIIGALIFFVGRGGDKPIETDMAKAPTTDGGAASEKGDLTDKQVARAPGDMPNAGGSGATSQQNRAGFGDVTEPASARNNETNQDSPSPGGSDSSSGGSSKKSQADRAPKLSGGMPEAANTALQNWYAKNGSKLVGVRGPNGKRERIPIFDYSWQVELLPHLGHQEVLDKFDFTTRWNKPENIKAAQTSITEFLNPNDDRKRAGKNLANVGLTHFVGVSGIEDDDDPAMVAAELPRTDPRAGVFGYDQVARREDITDGQAQTLMVVGAGEVVGPWVAAGGATIRGARRPYFDKVTGFGLRGLKGGGTMAIMADGSVRKIPKNIDPKVFRALCTIRGSETVDLSSVGNP